MVEAESPDTNVSFNTSGLRQTKVVSGFSNVTGALLGLEGLTIEDVVDPVDIVTFNFTLQVVDGTVPEWTMPFEVEFYEGGSVLAGTPVVEIPLSTVTTAVSTSAGSSFVVEGVLPGTYDVWVKGENTLAKLIENVEISAENNTVNLAEQVGGDGTSGEGGTSYNIVDVDDYNALLELLFNETSGLEDDQKLHDHNRDTTIDASDYGVVVTNFLQAGALRPGAGP